MANARVCPLSVIGWGGDKMKHLAHHIGVYIPTTAGMGHTVDATPLVEKTLTFLGERFGGATSIKGQGVWNSDAGLVSETVYIVQAFTTQMGMNRHLDDVVVYAKALKAALKQEAMALEVDRQLILL
jgi:hypothetical protein